MEKRPESAGAGPNPARPVEQPAVVTTIVGGRPPGAGQPVGAVPQGIEVLLKKASVDPQFRARLLDERADAAAAIGLALAEAEAMMLRAVPREQLETIIAQTVVPQEHRRAFLENAAAAILAALAVATPGCGGSRPDPPAPTGIAPDRPAPVEGIAPDRPAPRGIAPDRPMTKGIAPDRPTTFGIVPEEASGGAAQSSPAKQEAAKEGKDTPPPPPRGIRPDRPEAKE